MTIITELPDPIQTSGGNARGTHSIDLQLDRELAAEVASGEYSFNAGYSNKASGYQSVTLGGYKNYATGQYSVATGQYGSASHDFELVHGGGTTGSVYSQRSEIQLLGTTTNATPYNLPIDLGSNYATIASGSLWAFHVLVTGRTANMDTYAAYEFSGAIANIAGTTSLLAAVNKTVLGESSAGLDCDVVANDTDDRLDVQVTGAAGKTMTWHALIMSSQLRT